MPWLAQRFVFISLVVTGLFVTAPAQTAGGSQPLQALESVSASESLRDGIQIQAGSAVVRITALRNDIVRVRVSPNSVLPEDASWAVLPEARTKSIDVQPSQDASSVGFRTASLDVRVERDPLRIVIRDLEGNVISADAVGRPTKFQAGGFRCSSRWRMPNTTSAWATRQDSSTAGNKRTRCGTLTSGRKNRSTRCTRPSPFFLRLTARAAMEFFSTTPGAPGSISASRRAMRLPSARKAVRSTTILFIAPRRSRPWKTTLI